MKRQIISINEEKCNGCGLCASACHEGAIEIVSGKAKLTREDYCDGLGDCLPGCPTGAITFIEREALAYDKSAVLANKKGKSHTTANKHFDMQTREVNNCITGYGCVPSVSSKLAQWPCQIKLIPVKAPFFDEAKLLIAADCTAYAYANIHNDFMKGKVTLIGCPKLDNIDYEKKLTEIIKLNSIKNVTILRMEVPCCGKLEVSAKRAIQNSGKSIQWNVVTISTDGNICD